MVVGLMSVSMVGFVTDVVVGVVLVELGLRCASVVCRQRGSAAWVRGWWPERFES